MEKSVFVGLWIDGQSKPSVRFVVPGTCEYVSSRATTIFRQSLLMEAGDGCLQASPFWVDPAKYSDIHILHHLIHGIWAVRYLFETYGEKASTKTCRDVLIEILGKIEALSGSLCLPATSIWMNSKVWDRLDITKNIEAKTTKGKLKALYDIFAESPIDEYVRHKIIDDPIVDNMRVFVSNQKDYAWTEKALASRK